MQQYLDQGADINQADENGDTALHNAATFGYIDNVKFLLSKGADVNLRGDGGTTPLGNVGVFGKGNHEEITKLLLSKGADIDAQDDDGDTVLHSAVIWANLKNVKLFIDLGADIHIKNNNGDAPYEHACGLDSQKAMDILELFNAKGAKCE